MDNWAAQEGSPVPLGVSWIAHEQSYNFAFYSRHATAATLLFYSEQDFVNPVYQYVLTYRIHKSGPVWHCRIPRAQVEDARYYAYRVEGPSNPDAGHRFDSQKILLDPYAPAVFFPPSFSRTAAKRPGPNSGQAPLGVLDVGNSAFDWGADIRPRHTSDTIIYELHVKGFTQRENSGVSPEKRGTYTGLIEKIPYLQDLGITAVELLPVYQYDPDEGNYWGYMPLHFFSPHQQYADGQTAQVVFDEFRAMVAAFHAAGIEVLLDVVYNHTTEEDEYGPTYSYRGLDNHSYYLLEPGTNQYANDAGTGNVLRCAHPYVRKLIVDSMLFWAHEMHIDGFRFDLASILTRNSDGTVNLVDPPALTRISNDPVLARLRLIAEAWDISSYQLGRTFPGTTWLQWNGQFRDDVRSFVRGDNGKVRALMQRLYGSDDLFPDRLLEAYHAYQSVNYVTSHDGFCLYDLVSYNTKHNWMNGHYNRDGTDDNRSWNCGWEGDRDAPEPVLALRKQQIKNFCALLLLANGTPMFCAGDEFMHTQRGNNNPYNQDNEITWLDWSRLPKNQDIFRFFKQMIAFRKAHPTLGRSRCWREDVRWYGVGPSVDLADWSHSLAFYLDGASQGDRDLYVLINSYWEDLEFTVQMGQPGEWRRVADTALPSPGDIVAPGEETILPSLEYVARAHSVVILMR